MAGAVEQAQKFYRILSTFLLPLFPSPLWHNVIAPNSVLSMG